MEIVQVRNLGLKKVGVSISYCMFQCLLLMIPFILFQILNLVQWNLIPKDYESDLLGSLIFSWGKNNMNFIFILDSLLTYTITFYSFIYWIVYFLKIPYNRYVQLFIHLFIILTVYFRFWSVPFIGPFWCLIWCIFFFCTQVFIQVIFREKQYSS